MPDLTTLARYAAANSTTDSDLLSVCMEAAQGWLENAGVGRREDDKLYDLAVYMLATHYFDNRGVVQEGGSGDVPFGVMSIMHQLRNEPTLDAASTTDQGGDGG